MDADGSVEADVRNGIESLGKLTEFVQKSKIRNSILGPHAGAGGLDGFWGDE